MSQSVNQNDLQLFEILRQCNCKAEDENTRRETGPCKLRLLTVYIHNLNPIRLLYVLREYS